MNGEGGWNGVGEGEEEEEKKEKRKRRNKRRRRNEASTAWDVPGIRREILFHTDTFFQGIYWSFSPLIIILPVLKPQQDERGRRRRRRR